jgi:hypothetical protein
MIIPDFLFDFYRKVNYFGDILIPFLLFYFLIMVAENYRTTATNDYPKPALRV